MKDDLTWYIILGLKKIIKNGLFPGCQITLPYKNRKLYKQTIPLPQQQLPEFIESQTVQVWNVFCKDQNVLESAVSAVPASCSYGTYNMPCALEELISNYLD